MSWWQSRFCSSLGQGISVLNVSLLKSGLATFEVQQFLTHHFTIPQNICCCDSMLGLSLIGRAYSMFKEPNKKCVDHSKHLGGVHHQPKPPSPKQCSNWPTGREQEWFTSSGCRDLGGASRTRGPASGACGGRAFAASSAPRAWRGRVGRRSVSVNL